LYLHGVLVGLLRAVESAKPKIALLMALSEQGRRLIIGSRFFEAFSIFCTIF
jgi:hypothetical protein